MPRVKGRPRHCDPFDDESADSVPEADRPKDAAAAAASIERTVTTIFKCEKAKTSALDSTNEDGEREPDAGSNGVLPKSTTASVPAPSPSPTPAPLPPSAADPIPPPPPQSSKPANRSKRRRKAEETAGMGKKPINIKPKKVEQSAGEPLNIQLKPAEKPAQVLRPLRPLPQPVTKFVLPVLTPRPTKLDRDKVLTTCSVCSKVLRRGSLREHMDRHENSGKFECLTCGKNFSRASTLEKHVRAHTGERPYKCRLCPKAYRQKVHLAEHMRSHTGERPFVCRLCGFSVTSKSLLNRHLRTHGVLTSANDVPEMWLRTDAPTEQVLAAAAEVGRSLVELTQSESQQAGEAEERKPGVLRVTALNGTATVAALARRHLCDVCPAGFPTLQALRSHRLTTHGLATFHVCPTCEAPFPSTKALKVHCRTDHPQICPLCNEVMSQRRRWVLEVHLREKHPGISAESVLGPSPLSQRHIKRSAPEGRGNRAKTAGAVRKTGSKPRTDPCSNPDESLAEEVAVTKREMDHKDASLEESGDDLVVQLKFRPLNDHLLLTKEEEEEEEEEAYSDTDLEDSEGSIIQQLRGNSQSRSPSPSGNPLPNSHTDLLRTQP